MNTDILSDLVITKIRFAATMYSEKNKKISRINRPCWAIVIKYEGETVYTSNKKTYVSNINNMYILPKGCSYTWQCTAEGHFSIIEFDSELSCGEILHFPLKDGEKMLKMFKDLEYKRTVKKYMYEAESIRDCYSVILKLAKTKQQKYTPSDKRRKIAPAVDYIAKNYGKSIKNETLASLCGISEVYFRKIFFGVFGTPPIAYVHNLRIKKAEEMLKSDYGSITEIAKSLGYINIYDFSRDFKKHNGISPSKYCAKR